MPRPTPRPRLIPSSEVARRCGVSKHVVLRWAREHRIPTPHVVGQTFAWPPAVAAKIVAAMGRPTGPSAD